MKWQKFLIIIALLLTASLSAQDFANYDLDEKIPVDSSITIGKFENGLTYYIRKNQKPENRARLHLVVNAGSVLEDPDQQGLAHLCEHMAFNGTKHFARHDLINYLESIGMQFGPEINAYTGFDETVYMLQVPTDSSEMVETGFQILEDWARFISFEPEEIDKERGVVIEEWRLGRGANARMFDKHLPVLFKNSQYAERLPIGKKAVLDTFKHESLTSFYKDWYRPDLMAVIAVGDFDVQWIKSQIEKHFAGIPSAAGRERKVYSIPSHREPLFSVATDPEATRTIVRLYYKHDLRPDKTVRDYRQGFIESLYNTMLNTRLSELTQQADPPFLYGFSSDGRIVRTKGVYFLGAIVKEDGVERGMQALLTEANRVRQYGFTPGELERAKLELSRYMERAYKEQDKTESVAYAQEFARNYLTGEPIPGIAYEYALTRQYIDGIALDEVNGLAEEWLTDENRGCDGYAPEKEGLDIPTREELLSVFQKVDNQQIEAYVDNVSDEPLIADIPGPGTVTGEKVIEEIGVHVLTLSNGITVYAKPTDFKNDEVRFNAYSYGGDSGVKEEDYTAASTAADVLTEGGVDRFDKITLQKMLSGKVVNVRPWIGTTAEGISGSGSLEDLETLFQLIYLYITSPRKDTTAYQAYLIKLRGYLENRSAQPEAAFQDTLMQVLANYHFRSRPWSLDMIDEMDLDRSFHFYRERFADTDDFTFFFVGNLDMEALKTLSAQYLATLPAKPGSESWQDTGVSMPDGIVEKEVHKGMEPKSRVSIVFNGPFEWSKQNQFYLNSLADMLRIKLREVIREDLSGTYGVRVSAGSSRIPKQQYKFTISFGCDPGRVDELTTSIFAQIDTLKREGPDDTYLLKIKETDLRELEIDLKENAFWLSSMFSYHMDGLPVEQMLDRKQMIESLTVQDIQKAANDYIKNDRHVRVVLYPENE